MSPPGNAGGDACNVLQSTLSPAMGRTCGRRERGTDAGRRGGAIHSRARSQRWKAPWFAGCRQPSRVDGAVHALVGPYRLQGARSQAVVRTDDNRCPLEDEEGNVVSVRQAHAILAGAPNKRSCERGHVLRSVQRPVHVNRQSWSGASCERAEVKRRFWYRGRASPRKWE